MHSWVMPLAIFAGLPLSVAFLGLSCGTGDGARNDEELWEAERREMVDILRRYGIRDARVLNAMGRVRRHVYIPESFRRHGAAYGDHPCPIGEGQTISQPFIVAYMTEKLSVQPGERVLEIGTGSGYQAAVLAELGACVYSVEIVPSLADHARDILAREGYGGKVKVLTGDGYQGWDRYAPYDIVIGTCAPERIPEPLVRQLRDGGRMILPVGEWMKQRLVVAVKRGEKVVLQDDLPVRFVPMVPSGQGGGRDGSLP